MWRRVFLRPHFIRDGHFAERFGDDAFDVGKAAGDFETNADVSIRDSRLDRARQIISLRIPNRIAPWFSRKLYSRIRDGLETQFLRSHGRLNQDVC